MAFVKPFQAVMYRRDGVGDITRFVAPPYDVINAESREALIGKDPHNVVAIDLPKGPADPTAPGNRYDSAAATWNAWREEGILVEDPSPAIYVLEQVWEHVGRHVRRRAFIAATGLHAFDEGVVLPHERTLPKAIADRLYLTRACAANLSQVFGLFTDPAGETDDIFEAATHSEELLSATDADGVVSRLWAIRDNDTLRSLQSMLADKQIFIADGHHRYTTALAYRDERRAADAANGITHEAPPNYDFTLMALVNMDDPDLIVLPTHRLARADGTFVPDLFWAGLSENFDVVEPPSGHPAAALAAAAVPTFLVRTSDGTTRLASLRSDVDLATAIPTDASAAWKSIDVAVLQELVLRPLLGIHPDEPSTLDRLSFVKDAHEALKVADADVAFVLNATRMDQLRAVAVGGETMPQKSTYFYPKLLSGLLFRAMD
ncbi:MAG: DUF1015 domain-containing protein [Actinomycetota bacterium]|nr:DUF1015 domain-containing protein [Actinomycetota bacterium]MDP3629968.1 DUF1015 domain-containing protein [Actinomycetota bacterium]